MAEADLRHAREQAEAARLFGDAQKSIDRGHLQDARNRLELLLMRYPESHLIEVARRDLRTVYEKLANQLATPALPQVALPPLAPSANPPSGKPSGLQASGGYAPVRQPEDPRANRSRPDYPLPSPVAPPIPPGVQANPTAKAIDFLRDEFRNSAGDRIFFTEGSAEFGTRARVGLEAQSNWLKRNPGVSVVVEGHADDGGNRDFNHELSRRRAEAVKAKLVEFGVEPYRIEVLALGRDKPVTDCKTPACANQNRLVLTTISRVTLATSR